MGMVTMALPMSRSLLLLCYQYSNIAKHFTILYKCVLGLLGSSALVHGKFRKTALVFLCHSCLLSNFCAGIWLLTSLPCALGYPVIQCVFMSIVHLQVLAH